MLLWKMSILCRLANPVEDYHHFRPSFMILYGQTANTIYESLFMSHQLVETLTTVSCILNISLMSKW